MGKDDYPSDIIDNPDDEMKNFEEIGVGVKLDVQTLIFFQLNRLMSIMVTNPDMFPVTVEGLEILLSPYRDDKYNTKLKVIEETRDKANRRIINMRVGDKRGISSNNYSFATEKMKLLTELCERKHIYPIREFSYTIE